MVVEHIFITTMENAEAITAAGEMLARHKFVALGRQGFAVSDAMPSSAEFVRAKKAQFMRLSNRNFLQRAHKVRLDFDRGRVTVAVAMDDPQSTDFQITKRGGLFGRSKRRKALELQQQYLTGVASALEGRLARRDATEVAERSFTVPADEILALGRRQTRNTLIVLGVFIVVIVACVVIGVMSASHR